MLTQRGLEQIWKGLRMKSNEIYVLTKDTLEEWEEPYGWAPESAAEKIADAMKPWMIELTACLSIWEEKGEGMSDGELILACANMGSLIECWLKFFYCIYFEDYKQAPRERKNKDGSLEMIEPEEMSIENLKVFSRGILWEGGDERDKWVEKMQRHRNAIHAFNVREIGSTVEYIEDLERYLRFLKRVIRQLPPSPVYAAEHLI